MGKSGTVRTSAFRASTSMGLIISGMRRVPSCWRLEKSWEENMPEAIHLPSRIIARKDSRFWHFQLCFSRNGGYKLITCTVLKINKGGWGDYLSVNSEQCVTDSGQWSASSQPHRSFPLCASGRKFSANRRLFLRVQVSGGDLENLHRYGFSSLKVILQCHEGATCLSMLSSLVPNGERSPTASDWHPLEPVLIFRHRRHD